MKTLSILFSIILVFNPFIPLLGETLTVDGDLDVLGNSTSITSTVLTTENGALSHFRWVDYTTYPLEDGSGNLLPNQMINVEFADKFVWGVITVTLVGGWWQGKNTGMIRKSFAIGRNPGWSDPNGAGHGANSGEQLEMALGPITQRFKIGSATSEGGTFRIPIYRISDSKNDIKVLVEGYMSAPGPEYSIDLKTDIFLSEWEVIAEDHIPEEVINFDHPISISDYNTPANAVPEAGVVRWTGTDFEGYDGTAWKSFTSEGGGSSGGTADAASSLVIPGTTDAKLSVDASGNVLLSEAQGDISMGAFGAQ